MSLKTPLAALLGAFTLIAAVSPARAGWPGRCQPCPSYRFSPCYSTPCSSSYATPCGSYSTVTQSPPSPTPIPANTTTEVAKCFHLNAVIFELREGKEEVRSLKGIEEPLREKALGAIDAAITEVKKCMEDVHCVYKYKAPDKSPYPPEDKDNKHIRHALREVRHAKDDLRTVKGVTELHRDATLAAMDKAAEVLKDALDAAKN